MTGFWRAYLSLRQVRGATSQKAPPMRHPIRRLFRRELPAPMPVVITTEPEPTGCRGDTSDHYPRCSESALMCWEELVGRR